MKDLNRLTKNQLCDKCLNKCINMHKVFMEEHVLKKEYICSLII